jgi:hypothetical protein
MKTNKLCGKCRQPVEKETKLDYPYYCPHCDENLYEFETVQEATRKVIRREIYSAEEAAHSVELYAFMQENGFCDVYDFFQSDPDILRIKNSEVSFTEVAINENTTFVIYNDSEYQSTESEIKTMLQRFYSDNFKYYFTKSDCSWSVFRRLVNGIAYRGGKGYHYAIWEHKD